MRIESSYVSSHKDSLHYEFRRARSTAETELSGIDQAVKAHEQAHMAVLGGYAAGPIRYDYLMAADGTRYAVGGSIKVDLTPVPGDPEETIRKAKAIQFSAFAPGASSGADLRVAAAAYRMEAEARAEIARRNSGEDGRSGRAAAENPPRSRGFGPFEGDYDRGRVVDVSA